MSNPTSTVLDIGRIINRINNKDDFEHYYESDKSKAASSLAEQLAVVLGREVSLSNIKASHIRAILISHGAPYGMARDYATLVARRVRGHYARHGRGFGPSL